MYFNVLLGRQQAMEYLANRKQVILSKYFVTTYITSFHNDPVFTINQDTDNSNVSP